MTEGHGVSAVPVPAGGSGDGAVPIPAPAGAAVPAGDALTSGGSRPGQGRGGAHDGPVRAGGCVQDVVVRYIDPGSRDPAVRPRASTVADKEPKAGCEAIRFDKVDHVARIAPFLQLDVRDKIGHELTFVAGEFVSEHGKARRTHRHQLPLDSLLQLCWDTAQELIPVAEYDIAVDANRILTTHHHDRIDSLTRPRSIMRKPLGGVAGPRSMPSANRLTASRRSGRDAARDRRTAHRRRAA